MTSRSPWPRSKARRRATADRSEPERPRVAQGDDGDDGLVAVPGDPVAVPRDAVAAVAVQVRPRPVELDAVALGQHHAGPLDQRTGHRVDRWPGPLGGQAGLVERARRTSGPADRSTRGRRRAVRRARPNRPPSRPGGPARRRRRDRGARAGRSRHRGPEAMPRTGSATRCRPRTNRCSPSPRRYRHGWAGPKRSIGFSGAGRAVAPAGPRLVGQGQGEEGGGRR